VLKSISEYLCFSETINFFSVTKDIRLMYINKIIKPYYNYKESIFFCLDNSFRKKIMSNKIMSNQIIILNLAGIIKVPKQNLNIKKILNNIHKLNGVNTIIFGNISLSIFKIEDIIKIKNVKKITLYCENYTDAIFFDIFKVLKEIQCSNNIKTFIIKRNIKCTSNRFTNKNILTQEIILKRKIITIYSKCDNDILENECIKNDDPYWNNDIVYQRSIEWFSDLEDYDDQVSESDNYYNQESEYDYYDQVSKYDDTCVYCGEYCGDSSNCYNCAKIDYQNSSYKKNYKAKL
jgi:hypothetical protein